MITSNRISFYIAVWEIVGQIPPGKVATYGQIASMITPPEGMEEKSYRALSPRWVGAAMAACPEDIPWQRVVNSQGKISLQGEGATLQKERLVSEGIEFSPRERISLEIYQWQVKEKDDKQLDIPL